MNMGLGGILRCAGGCVHSSSLMYDCRLKGFFQDLQGLQHSLKTATLLPETASRRLKGCLKTCAVTLFAGFVPGGAGGGAVPYASPGGTPPRRFPGCVPHRSVQDGRAAPHHHPNISPGGGSSQIVWCSLCRPCGPARVPARSKCLIDLGTVSLLQWEDACVTSSFMAFVCRACEGGG